MDYSCKMENNEKTLRNVFREEAINILKSYHGDIDFSLSENEKIWVAGYIAAKLNSFSEEDLILAYNLGADQGASFQRQVTSGIFDENFDEECKSRFKLLIDNIRQFKFEESFK